MALPDILSGLLGSAAYPHPCSGIRLVETHISWVVLTGHYAYKIKKPVHLPFVDFSSLERRRFFCGEELRCNRRFAPALYLDVVPIRLGADGSACVGAAGVDDGAAVEWAVRMLEFPAERELERLLEAGELTTVLLRDFGVRLGAVHLGLPSRRGAAAEVEARVLAPVAENFATLRALQPGPEATMGLGRIEAASGRRADRLASRFATRLEGGYTRECHGDLHLGNLVLLDGAVTAFDCLEFDANLRWIDTLSDVAFLFMDCLVRERPDLGYAFLDGYLDATGDYEGVALLPFYAVYRAMVRAKVAGIQASQARAAGAGPVAADQARALAQRMLAHLRWAERWFGRLPGRVVLMSGVSGSGKSYLAERLAPLLPAVRIRSDVARRAMAGESSPAGGGSSAPDVDGAGHVDTGRYAPERILAVYRRFADLLPDLVEQGETVILDATFISAAARATVLERARRAGWEVLIVACSAPRALLESRIRQRLASGGDPSEADVAVLDRQLARREPFGPHEPVLEVDTSTGFDAERLAGLAATIAAHPGMRAGGGSAC